jgi:uncharacterized protein
MTHDEIEDLATRFFDAVQAGDTDTIEALYHPDARIWHNNDQLEQTVPQNMKVIRWLIGATANMVYSDIRRVIVADGFVQQHVLTGDAPGGRLVLPAMQRVYVADGLVTRIEEYIDTAQSRVLRTATSASAAPGQ